VLVEGRQERKPRGLYDVGGRCPDRDPAAPRQLDLELDLADRLAAGPTECARNATTRAATPVAREIE